MRHDSDTKALLEHFSDPDAVARYVEGPPRFVPGFADLHRMTGILLAEHAPENAEVLVVGAGGGLEVKALAEAHPLWTFVGVDPAAEMLKLAKRTLGPLSSRVRLHQGYIDDAPQGPFDAGTCLLTLHFLDAEERRRTASEIRRRLRPGAPFVAAHSSFTQDEPGRGSGCPGTPPMRSHRGWPPGMPTTPERRSKAISVCSAPSKMRRSCATPAFRT